MRLLFGPTARLHNKSRKLFGNGRNNLYHAFKLVRRLQSVPEVRHATTDAGAAKITAALSAYAGCKGAKLDVNDAAGAEAAEPGETEVRGMLSGHICRCTGYTPIVAAVLEVARARHAARKVSHV